MPAPIPGIMAGASLKSGLTLPPGTMQAIPAGEARRLDLNCSELGIGVDQLMANAGRALAKAVEAQWRRFGKGRGIVFVCGKGNNGGDGLAAASLLLGRGLPVHVVLAQPPREIASAAARAQFQRLAPEACTVWSGRPGRAWAEANVLVDCLLGSGLSGAPREPYAAIIRALNARRSKARIVACDIPSGLGGPLQVHPHATVTFQAPKLGMTAANSGALTVAPIGIPAAAHDAGLGDLDAAYRRPAWDSHKGDNGLIIVVGGSVPLVGAPHYVASAAYRTGADLVHLAVPTEAAAPVRNWGPQGIVHAVGRGSHLTVDALPTIESLLDRCTAAVVGPGLGRHQSTVAATRQVLDACAERDLPTVVDADGLDALDDALLRRHGARMVLTPHAREFLDLSGKAATRANVQAYARQHGVTVLRKSAVDIIAGPLQTRACRRGHPTLTVGGTGDVLAGTVATLLAKGANPFDAACAASYLVKSAGEVAASLRSYGATALDVADAIPSILLRLP